MMHPGWRSIAVAAAVALAGCGGKGGGGDEGCPAPDPWVIGGDGADVTVPPPAGEARAGRILGEGAIPPGVKRQVDVGDVMMRNGRALFVIEGGGGSDGYGTFGGEIVHADLVGADGEPLGLDRFGESFHGLSYRMLDPTSVTVIADGSDGGDAVVRVVGTVTPMPLLDMAFAFLFEVNDVMDYSADFVLGPDDEFLEIRFDVRSMEDRYVYLNLMILGTVQGDGLALFTPESGFDGGGLGGGHALYGHVGRDLSYGWLHPLGEDMTRVLAESGMLIADRGDTIQFEACEEQVVPMVRLVVAGGGAESLLAAARRARGEAEPPATTFEVTVAGGGDAGEAVVHVTDGAGAYVTSVVADPDGEWHAGLAEGSYLATAVLEGHPPLGDVPFAVTAAGGSLAVAIPEAATLSYTVLDQDGAPGPAKIIVVPDTPIEPLPAAFGVAEHPNGAQAYVFTATGTGSLPVPPGSYTVTASRGPEYEIDEQAVTAVAGEEVHVDMVLDHSVDSTGIMCADLHAHSWRSADSYETREYKVIAAAAEGLDVIASTDHEWVDDYQPDIEAAGLGAIIHGFAGEELTTFAYGHFNVLGQTIDTDAPNDGAVDWYYADAPEVFDRVHADPLDPILQVNHPASEAFQGYFTAVGFDPVAGTVARPELWSTDFQAVEVFNSKSFAENEGEGESVPAWFALVDMGLRFAATGNSDTHDAIDDELGWQRTCFILGHDDPATFTVAEMKQAIRGMEVLVSGGILVTAEGPGGELPGGLVDAGPGTADFHVVVQAPLWIAADRLRVFVGGVEADTITLDGTTADPGNPVVRFDDTITVVVAGGGDGWVVFEAEGDMAMDPVVDNGSPFGVTNPIYVDGDGDGEFTPARALP